VTWPEWVLLGAAVWVAVAVPVALVIGKSIRQAENRRPRSYASVPDSPAELRTPETRK